jgi:hypothetical protein
MRWLAGALLLTAIAGACTGNTVEVSSPVPTAPSPTPTVSATPAPTGTTSPSPSPTPLRLPADAPATFAESWTPAQFAAEEYADLAPPDATVTSTAVLTTPDDPFDQIGLIWRRGEDPFASEHGLVVWRRYEGAPAWRAIHAFTDRPTKGVLGITLDPGDVTGDRIDDLLTFELQGGSGACGVWRVTGSLPDAAPEIFRWKGCDAELTIVDGGLHLREAVYEPDDAHCCPSSFRITRFEWDGEAFAETSREVRASAS